MVLKAQLVEQKVALKPLKVEALCRCWALVEVKQMEKMSPRSKMEVELKAEHVVLMVVEGRAEYMMLKAGKHKADDMKLMLMVVEHRADRMMRLMLTAEEGRTDCVVLTSEVHEAEHVKKLVTNFLFLSCALRYCCFSSSSELPEK